MTLASIRMAHRAPRGGATGCLLAVMVLAGARSLLGDVASLTLYEKTARAPLVVRARALSGSTRRPRLRVLEVLKGSYHADEIVVVPHFEDHTSPTPWLKREVFRKGEASILFLRPHVDRYGRDAGPRAFAVLGAAAGKLAVPAEGAEALLSAIRTFARIVALGQHDRQAEELRELLRERNPRLVEAGLAECRKFRLARPADIDVLIGLTRAARPDFRTGALALLAQVVEEVKGAAAGRAPRAPLGRVFDRVAAAARLDPEEAVRRQAVRVLEAFGGDAALALIERIGVADASQTVRYEAQVAAYRLRQKLR